MLRIDCSRHKQLKDANPSKAKSAVGRLLVVSNTKSNAFQRELTPLAQMVGDIHESVVGWPLDFR